jgi:DNA-binding IclR family transcriptional regulator
MIQVIVRAFDILEFVAAQGKEPVQLYKIAEHVKLSQPTTANIVKTMLEKNYLEQLGRKKGYKLGIAAYQLTGNPSYQINMVNAAKEPMQELTNQLNETSLLAMIRNNKRVILKLVECHQVLQVKAVFEAEVYETSTGRLLMAYLEPKELNSLIKANGLPTKKVWAGAETKPGLEKILKKIREEEFVQVYSKHHTVGFAVPVYKGTEVIAGLSIFVPESRYTDSHKEKIFKLIHKAAKKISEGLI